MDQEYGMEGVFSSALFSKFTVFGLSLLDKKGYGSVRGISMEIIWSVYFLWYILLLRTIISWAFFKHERIELLLFVPFNIKQAISSYDSQY